ncbi:MAG: radical SAM protein [Syntrophomonadaceae bacterium]|nr:radical SAM protein [Syntrophomonadaceae bacterium]
MIGCTKLLCGTATVSEAIKYERDSRQLRPGMLQFSTSERPLVVWNTTNRCNLRCQHCYLDAEDRAYSGELTTEQARSFIHDLAEMKAPVLLFSGGEPVLRRDLLELGRLAADLGLRPVLSTNGTLITPELALKLQEAGFQYVGVSVDGAPATHDRFRDKEGAFAQALRGIKSAAAIGLKTGVRFTVNRLNQEDLDEVLQIVEKEGIPRFCMYHLVYSGRGRDLSGLDTSIEEKRKIMENMVRSTLDLYQRGVEVEILTTDNHADGIFLYNYVLTHQPERAEEILKLLEMHGGCSAGTKFANVDPQGNVHPCQFWQHYTLGNVKERKFSEIWQDKDEPLLVKLRQKQDLVKGRCGACQYKAYCGGCRVRAEAVTGDLWAEDPACYLTDQEIGLAK